MSSLKTLYEYEEWEYEQNYSEKRVFQNWLLNLSQELKKNKVTDKEFLRLTEKGIEFRNYCGFITHNDMSLEILPKVYNPDRLYFEQLDAARLSLITMISYTNGWKIPKNFHSNMKRSGVRSFHEILFFLFLSNLSEEIERGLYHKYKEMETSDRTLRGSLLVERQLFEPDLSIFHLRVYEYDYRNDLNNFFYTITRMILGISRVKANHIMAFKILSTLEGCRIMERHRLSGFSMVFNRLNSRFKNSYLIGKTIIEKTSLTVGFGIMKVPLILIDMNQLFEDFFAEFINRNVRSVLPGYKPFIQPKGRWHLLENGKFSIRPDIALINDRDDTLIMDTKYKPFRPQISKNAPGDQKIEISDLYQMYAYAKKTGSKKLFLVYPETETSKNIFSLIGNFDDETSVYSLRLLLNFEDLNWEYKLSRSLSSIYEIVPK